MRVQEFGQQNDPMILLLHGGGLSWWNYRDTRKINKADMITFLKANSLYTIKPSLPETKAKVKIVAGSREQKNIRDSAKLLYEAIPGSSMELLSGLRHGDLSINCPERYAQILTDWIGR